MQIYQAERSLIQSHVGNYKAYGKDRFFLDGGAVDRIVVQHCALVDLTNLARVGFRGLQTADYLTSLGFDLPQYANRLVTQADGCHVARLSATEYLVLGGLSDVGEKIAQLEFSWTMDERLNYLLPRQDSHACIQLTGAYLGLIMAKLCAVDFSVENFQVGQVAQTSVARVNAIVMNVSDDVAPKFNILCDRAASLYLWEVLLDAIQEFNGKIVGIDALI